jgi:hypothetical protein
MDSKAQWQFCISTTNHNPLRIVITNQYSPFFVYDRYRITITGGSQTAQIKFRIPIES